MSRGRTKSPSDEPRPAANKSADPEKWRAFADRSRLPHVETRDCFAKMFVLKRGLR